MRCPHHFRNEVVGYCTVCGGFGCAECMTKHEGAYYCKRDYRPIAEKLEKQRRHEEVLSRPERQRLVVHSKDGEVAHGVCFALKPSADGFHLDMVDSQGQPIGKASHYAFKSLKAVFYVKSFDGNFEATKHFYSPHEPGQAMVVEFEDGEIMHGHATHSYSDSEPRFYIIPDNPQSNNISTLVERDATAAVYSAEEYKKRRRSELEDYVTEHESTGHPREELIGDFHFTRHEYIRAYKSYKAALAGSKEPPRIAKKASMAQYNIGVRHIKQHDYHHALSCMKAAVDLNPDNEKAKKKAEKLRSHLKRRKHGEEIKTKRS